MSVTIAGLIVTLISIIAKWLDWNVPWTSDELSEFLVGFLTLAGLIIAWFGRWRKGDIGLLGIKLK